MKRKIYTVILLALVPALVNALGLGNLDLNSALNEPFDARIQLLSPTADELDALTIGLADSEAFARAKIDRPFILGKLKFSLRRSVDDGPDYIRVYSQDPIREPFLNFLVEVSWSNGRLFREYTVLLDPPLYDPNARAGEFTQNQVKTTDSIEPVISIDPDHKVVTASEFEQTGSAPVSKPNVNYASGDYGPTEKSDTLWSIASAMRPNSSTSVNKMMLALLRANPEAFFNQNINGLKSGQILRMPNESEINALTNAQALADVQSQHAAWDNIKDNLSSAVSERPEVSSVPESSDTSSAVDTTEAMVESEAELKLVAAKEEGEATQQVSSVDAAAGDDLVLAKESIQALTSENIELKDRLQESEALLEDLKRLLLLKDDELAALQGQTATQALTEEEDVSAIEEFPADQEELAVPEVDEIEQDVMDETVGEESTDEEETATVDEEDVDVVDDVIEVIETEPATSTGGVMGMVDQYLGPVREILLGNPVVGMAIGGFLILLIIVIVVMKFKKKPAETVSFDAMTEEAFPDFDSGSLGDTGSEDLPDSEAVTVLPDSDSEAETAVHEAAADVDLEEEKPELISEDDTPAEVAEEESDEDPLQEVNTYLAFEQFDQAEEFVRNVISSDPENPEYHTKLLEVFYTSGNKKSYEEAAKVLHDIVGGEGEHWNMATAMWQEMSPTRALFAEGGGDDDEDSADTTGGGFVDVTADDETGDSGGLDFDIGGAEEETAASGQGTEEAEEILDITSSNEGEDMLDLTASDEGEDMLDVTAAVGLGDLDDSDSDDVLDISGSSAGTDDLLDLTSGEESTGEDLLDVTAASNLDLDSEEDLLDVTAATSADSDGLLDFELENDASDDNPTLEFDVADLPSSDESKVEDDNSLDFDLGTNDNSPDLEIEANESEEDAGLDMDLDAGLEMDLGESEKSEIDDSELSLDLSEDDSPIRLDVEEDTETADDEISLDFDMGEDDALELDVPDETANDELEIDVADEASTDSDMDLDFEFSIDEPSEDDDISLDLDGTVEMPKSMELTDDDDDDDEHTVFVPRAAQPDEQSSEDEIATKLDLAKAYVELGDKDSAKAILDEVIADGNDEQRKQAEDLLEQV